jgi:hypothetical protein
MSSNFLLRLVSITLQFDGFTVENLMIVRRRTWLYRLNGQLLAQPISFAQPVTASMARNFLRRYVGIPLDLWGRDCPVMQQPPK